VYGEPELTAKYRVGPDGKISFPFCGSLHVDTKTSSEVAELLTGCLQKTLKDPQVSVLELEVGSRKKITVFGLVQKPGTFPYEDRMSIVQAVALAGGFAQFAGQNSATVTRVTEQGEEVKFQVPVKDIGTGAAPNFYLLPGDIVFVPESPL
jgi:polysaccharide export outer membrane protein